MRESTSRAIEDAKRAAEVIRGEAVNVEREAAAALERLRDAAEAARSAAIGARTAIETTDTRRNRAPTMRAEPRSEPRYEEPAWRDEPEPQAPDYDRRPPERAERSRDRDFDAPSRRGDDAMFGEPSAPATGNWTWRDLLSNVDNSAQQKPAPQRERPRVQTPDPVARLTQTISEPRSSGPSLPAGEMIERSGLRLSEVFSGSGLERIAQRARSGTQARRRAVRDAAPDAVQRLADFLAHNAHANQEALQFLRSDGARIAELLSRGRAAMNADATRAFLLIDSAAG